MEADTRARHRTEEKIADARLRLISEYERIAYSDVRDVVQWDREAELDQDGNVIGFKDTMRVTPSHLLTREQAAQVRSVTTKSGALKFEVHDKLAALVQLAKILRVAPEPQSQTVNNTQVNVIGSGGNALEDLKRLAFAIEGASSPRSGAPRGEAEPCAKRWGRPTLPIDLPDPLDPCQMTYRLARRALAAASTLSSGTVAARQGREHPPPHRVDEGGGFRPRGACSRKAHDFQ